MLSIKHLSFISNITFSNSKHTISVRFLTANTETKHYLVKFMVHQSSIVPINLHTTLMVVSCNEIFTNHDHETIECGCGELKCSMHVYKSSIMVLKCVGKQSTAVRLQDSTTSGHNRNHTWQMDTIAFGLENIQHL